jgi:hypothetical protein
VKTFFKTITEKYNSTCIEKYENHFAHNMYLYLIVCSHYCYHGLRINSLCPPPHYSIGVICTQGVKKGTSMVAIRYHVDRRWNFIEIHIQSSMRVHGVVLNYVDTGTTLPYF